MTDLVPIEDRLQAALADTAPPPSNPLAPGLALTVWSSDGVVRAWTGARELLARVQPEIVQLHSWPQGAGCRQVAREVRVALPRARLWIGAGIDGVARQVRAGRWSVSRGARELAAIARAARDLGAEVLVLDPEAAWKAPPGTPVDVQIEALVTAGLAGIVAAAPGLVIGHTAYDHPTYHSDYPWRAWLGRGSPVALALPQVYAAPAGDYCAHRGALPRREARALRSWAAAVRAGWITADDPSTPVREGVLWRPYYQGHHVTCADTVASAVEHPLACLWAVPTRVDAEGRLALLALCELWRRGFWGAGGVQRFQASAGLVADGVCGPKTCAALGVAAGA